MPKLSETTLPRADSAATGAAPSSLQANSEGSTFDQAQRECLRAHVHALTVEYGSIVRARQIAKDTGLVTLKDGPIDQAGLKRLLPDAGSFYFRLLIAFGDKARRRAALQTLYRLGDEAFRSTKVDHRL